MNEPLFPPIAMLAEITHRCPLQCPYCSNPTELVKANRELAADAWISLFGEAADLGVLQVHLSGGEPTVRRDLEAMVAALTDRHVYTNLITSGIGLTEARIASLADAGLDHLQLSIQGARPASADQIAHLAGAYESKCEVARMVRAAGLPLTINAPIHRHNIEHVSEIIDLAVSLGAERLEIAHVQYAGWALINRDALMPDREAVERQIEIVEAARSRLRGIMNIDFVAPDYFAIYPKPCMGGWARDAFVVAPDGSVLPCHAAQTIPGLCFDRYGDRTIKEIWTRSSAFAAFRGTSWMREPCRSCERREIDWGGCRCQAMAIAGDATAADPACVKSPLHERMSALVDKAQAAAGTGLDGESSGPFTFRRFGNAVSGSGENKPVGWLGH